MEVETHLNTSKVKLFVTSHVNPAYHRKTLYFQNLHFSNTMPTKIIEDFPTRPNIIIEDPPKICDLTN